MFRSFIKAVLGLVLVLVITCSAGCAASGAASGVQVSTDASISPSITPSVIYASATTVPATRPATATVNIQPAIEPTSLPTVLTPISRPPFQICSPLESESIDKLYQIISDPYRPPPPGKDERHQGVDFSHFQRGERASIQGEGIQAVLRGWVAAAIADSFPFGNLVIVETRLDELPGALIEALAMDQGESLYLLYAHMEAPPQLSPGDTVEVCQRLGTVGKSGNAGVAHLHLETRLGPLDQLFPSMSYYLVSNTEEERENYLMWRTSGDFRHFDPMELLYFIP